MRFPFILPSLYLSLTSALLLTVLASAVVPERGSALQHPMPGDRIGEPTPSSDGVRLLDEVLTFDLRPLTGKDARVAVHARYRAYNDGPAQTIRLEPVSPLPRVPGGRADGSAVGTKSIRLESAENTFELDARAVTDLLPRGEVRSYAIDYEVAGAQRWKALGPLTVNVLLPAGWRILEAPVGLTATSSPDHYAASFSSYPRRPLLIRVQPPLAAHYALWAVQLTTQLGAVALAVFAVRRQRRAALHVGVRPLHRRLLAALGYSPLLVALPLCGLFMHARLYPYLSDIRLMLGADVVSTCIAIGYCWVGHVRRARAA